MIAAAMATSARTLASAPCAVPPAVGAPLPTRAKTPTIEGEVSSSKREIEKSATNCHGRRGKRCRWPSRGSAATCPSPWTSSSVFALSLPTARGTLDSHALGLTPLCLPHVLDKTRAAGGNIGLQSLWTHVGCYRGVVWCSRMCTPSSFGVSDPCAKCQPCRHLQMSVVLRRAAPAWWLACHHLAWSVGREERR